MKKLLCFLVPACLFILSCQKNEAEAPDPAAVLTISKTSVFLAADIYAADTTLVTENINWTATTTAPWLKIEIQYIAGQPDKLIIAALDNNFTGTSRSATVILSPVNTTSIQPITITVIQQKLINPSIVWSKLFGGAGWDIFNSMAITADGGYIMAGYSESNNGDVSGNHGKSDALVVKVDENGNKLWSKLFGGSGADYANSIIATPDGGCVVAGSAFSNDGDVSSNNGVGDIWVMKLGASGNKQWSKLFGGAGVDEAKFVIATADGGYVVASSVRSSDGDASGNHGADDALIMKLDANGNKLWRKLFGGTLGDFAYSLIATADGGYVIVGGSESSNGDVSGNHGKEDGWVIKLDANGTKQWSKLFGGAETDRIHSIIATTDGGYMIAGASKSNDGDVSGNHGLVDAWVMKVDANGNKQWSKLLGAKEYDDATAILATADGGYVIAGGSHSNDGDVVGNHGVQDTWVVKLDASGNTKWSKLFGGALGDYALSMLAATDGGYVLAGHAHSSNGEFSSAHGGGDAWLLKIKP